MTHDIGCGVALRHAAHTEGRADKLVLSNATAYGSWPVEYVTSLGLPRTLERDPEAFRDEVDRAFVDGLERADPDPEWTEERREPWLRSDGQRAFVRAAVATNANGTAEIDYEVFHADAIDDDTVRVGLDGETTTSPSPSPGSPPRDLDAAIGTLRRDQGEDAGDADADCDPDEEFVEVLTSVDGLGSRVATRMEQRFDSLEDVADASNTELQEVEWAGPKARF